jgi:filamentous hemagglutinin family protein
MMVGWCVIETAKSVFFCLFQARQNLFKNRIRENIQMSNNSNFKIAALAASIALAMGSTAAMAASPTATQLPGEGKTVLGTATAGAISGGSQTITLGSNAVINWGVASGATINTGATAQPGGFNIGSGAMLTFADGGNSVLNVDVSGNASQLMGTLNNTGAGNIYVANTNGIIVGATASISAGGEVGLIGNKLGNYAFTGNITSTGYDGTGGDVTVATGASLGGATVLVSGGGTVNVGLSTLTRGNATLSAGLMNSAGTFGVNHPAASLVASGALGGATLAGFHSAGNASSSGTLNLGSNAAVAGTLTNTGTMDLGNGFNIAGAVVNGIAKMTQSGRATMGSLSNAGEYDGRGNYLHTTAGGLSNSALMSNMGYVRLNGGDFVNNGQFGSNGNDVDTYGGGNITNNGKMTGLGYVDIYEGGNFINTGSLGLGSRYGGGVYVVNGSITNTSTGSITGGDYLDTASDDTTAGFTAGADYSIINSGTVRATGRLTVGANSADWGDHNGTAANDSTGSVTNTGVLQVGQRSGLTLYANNSVNLDGMGTVQAWNGSHYAALSATNPLNYLYVSAGYDGNMLNGSGTVTLQNAITSSGGAEIYGNQINLMSNLSSVDSSGNPSNQIYIVAGAAPASGYAVRVASGKTVSANSISVNGDAAGDHPNVILQGTLAANSISFGNRYAVGDIFSGPTGSLSMFSNASGPGPGPGILTAVVPVFASSPTLYLNSTGRVKTAPYLNSASNFRFNDLPVNVTDGSTLTLNINPSNEQGTPLSAVNLLVNSNVNLSSTMGALIGIGGSAVTGITNMPNTHLVLQSSGNIATTGSFYWPGYVYLGNVLADANTGAALQGTLGYGSIALGGDFNNVLPGDVAGGSGIHFITQFPLLMNGYNVITNANALVNFGTDLLTKAYAMGAQGGGHFFGGAPGTGTGVVNYGALDPSKFVTQTPSATR